MSVDGRETASKPSPDESAEPSPDPVAAGSPVDAGAAEPAAPAATEPATPAEGLPAGTAGEPGEAAADEAAKPAAATPEWENFAPVPVVPARPAGRVRRVGRGVGRFLRHEWTLASLAGLVLAAVMFWPAVVHPSTTITSDIWDPTLQAWQMAWSGHIIGTDPAQLWNSNSFFPSKYSFAFSDTLLGYFPAGLIGSGPVAAVVRYNVLFVLIMALSFVGAYALVRQLGAGKLGAAVAGVAFAYAPWRWSQAGHMHVMSVGGIMLALAMLARGHGFSLRDGWRPERAKPGWAFAGWLVAAWEMSISFGIGIPFAYVLGIVGLVAVVTWLRRRRPRLGRRLVLLDALGLLIFGAVSAFMARPYFEVLHLYPEATRSIDTLSIFSPTLRSFFTAPAQSWVWGDASANARSTMVAPAETTLLAGFALYGLAFFGLFYSSWRVRTRVWLCVGIAVTALLSLGTHVPGGHHVGYVLLYKYAPGWDAIRTPGRVFLWTTLLFAILAAGGVDALVKQARQLAEETTAGRPRLVVRLALLIPLLLVTVEGINALDHPDVPKAPAVLRTLDGPIMVLPSDQTTDEIVMLWATTKFQPIVNGGSGFVPNQLDGIRQQTKSFPDQQSVDALRALGVKSVVVLRQPPPTLVADEYAKAENPDVPIDGLGITRTVADDVIVYALN